ncbi:MAG: DUF1648 domain-containing protein [Candidatus Omnitrophica bacterium]|nr:DUF1648 domain-containing protein [Candidatus Omnitrophota bacterium]
MTKNSLSLSVVLVLCAMYVVHALYYYPQLPNTVASHFDTFGRPDGWSSKASFLINSLISAGSCMLVLVGFSFAIRRLPDSIVDRFLIIPDKDYWLAPEYRRETLDAISRCGFWAASAVLLMMFALDHQAIRVNLDQADSLEHSMLIICCGLVLVVASGIEVIVRFRKRGSQPSNPADS